MRNQEKQSNPSTPNALKVRDPELVKHIAAFQSRLGEILLDALAPALARPAFSGRHDILTDLYAAAQILRVLTRDEWTERDLVIFDTNWRDACRSDFFADELEAEKFRIQAAVEIARKNLLKSEIVAPPQKVMQPTLW